MATYYVDPTASGSDTGADQTNAWTSLQRAIDGTNGTQPTAGDTIYLKHSNTVDETITATINLDGGTGSSTTGYIRWIGVNSSWTRDGTQYVIKGDTTTVPVNIFAFGTNTDYNVFENIDVSGASSDGISFATSGPYGNVFINVSSHNNASDGFYCYRNPSGFYYKCKAYSNSGKGFKNCTGEYKFCTSYNNTSDGFEASYAANGSYMLGCIAAYNHGRGFYSMAYGMPLINCVSHANYGDGVYLYNSRLNISGCRITKHDNVSQAGIDCNAQLCILDNNYFQGNTDDLINQVASGAGVLQVYDGATNTNTFAGSDTDYGYSDPSSTGLDFNLTSSATKRDIEIELP